MLEFHLFGCGLLLYKDDWASESNWVGNNVDSDPIGLTGMYKNIRLWVYNEMEMGEWQILCIMSGVNSMWLQFRAVQQSISSSCG